MWAFLYFSQVKNRAEMNSLYDFNHQKRCIWSSQYVAGSYTHLRFVYYAVSTLLSSFFILGHHRNGIMFASTMSLWLQQGITYLWTQFICCFFLCSFGNNKAGNVGFYVQAWVIFVRKKAIFISLLHIFNGNFNRKDELTLCPSTGEAAWLGNVNCTKWARLVIRATLSRCCNPRGLWTSNSWHVRILIIQKLHCARVIEFCFHCLWFNMILHLLHWLLTAGLFFLRIKGDQQHFVRRDELKVQWKTVHSHPDF